MSSLDLSSETLEVGTSKTMSTFPDSTSLTRVNSSGMKRTTMVSNAQGPLFSAKGLLVEKFSFLLKVTCEPCSQLSTT